jgi:cyclophilin family peptidyl-prolyl cis-trans isomerase/predicted GIY-YIG superfamily endonuclease
MKKTGGYFVYVLRCSDGSFYTGWTNELSRRIASHQAGVASRYTRSRLPVAILAYWSVRDRSAALVAEAAFKRYTRAEKAAALLKPKVLGHRIRKAPFIDSLAEGCKEKDMPTYAPPSAEEKKSLAEEARTHRVRITTKHGEILVKLYPDEAPLHCAAFMKLARTGFYDGLTFHRVEAGFVIQGGCPQGDGTGGPGYQLPAEFNKHKHVKGTLAMARSSDRDSAGSQFYLCLGEASFLDGQYTVFGDTVEGLEVIEQVRRGDKIEKITIEPAA